MNVPIDEGLIVRYLLGDLSDHEQVEIEDRAFSDAQYLQSILAVEADLIDEYVRGGLYENERRQFENRFLASNEGRQKVQFAKALAKVAGESVVTETSRRPVVARATTSWWSSFIAALGNASPAVRLSMAAASLVLVIGAAFLTWQTIRLSGEVTQLQAEQKSDLNKQKALEKQFTDERALSQDLAARLENEQQQRQHTEELIRDLEHEREESANRPPQPTIFSFVLLPGLSRSGGALPKLVVPQSAGLVRLQLGLEQGDEYKSFAVELRTQAGKQIWTQDRLSAQSPRAGRLVVLSVPAKLLDAGKYEVALKGVLDGGKIEDVGYYYFEVQKK
ncbi:MAG TPA: hypothetical protein VNS63_27765 [Blastocatellia bacterium]|nr:hypothetical protein [Blastocatellia bacterium]